MFTPSRIWQIILALILITVVSLYVLIPNSLKISRVQVVHAPPSSFNRFFQGKNDLRNWWNQLPGQKDIKNDSIFTYQNQEFTIHQKIYPLLNIEILFKGKNYESHLIPIQITKDTTALQWNLIIPNSWNPIEHYKNYKEAEKLSFLMSNILSHFKTSFENSEFVYGIPIHEFKLENSFFIAKKLEMDHPPTVLDTYFQVKSLMAYAQKNKAVKIDSPMLHWEKIPESGRFQMMVGIPIDREIPNGEGIEFKRMPKMGRMLSGEVKGGESSIQQGFSKLQLYMSDIQLGSPAIPFQVLQTNRLVEKDTNRWITKLYYPIM